MRRITFIAAICLLFSFNAFAQNQFTYEREVIDGMSAAMEKFSQSMEEYNSSGDIVKAVKELNTALKDLAPKIREVGEKYPDWGDNPPAELESSMERFLKASEKFSTESMPALFNYANAHSEDEALIEEITRMGEILQ